MKCSNENERTAFAIQLDHYRTLLHIDNQDKKEFYIAEAAKNNWAARHQKNTT